jgi:hypothetical protein
LKSKPRLEKAVIVEVYQKKLRSNNLGCKVLRLRMLNVVSRQMYEMKT